MHDCIDVVSGPFSADEPLALPTAEQASDLLKSMTGRAACSHLDTEVFFPPASDDPATVPPECGACPVRAECLEVGLSPLGEYGIWGGTTEGERDRMRRGRRRHELRRRGVESPDSPVSPAPKQRRVRRGVKREQVERAFDEVGLHPHRVRQVLAARGVSVTHGYVQKIATATLKSATEQVGHRVPDLRRQVA